MTVVLLLKRHLPVFIVGLILLTMAVFSSDTAYLKIDMSAQERNYLQIFWTGSDGNFTAEKSVTVRTKEGRHEYVVPISNSLFAQNVRVDIQQSRNEKLPAPVTVHAVSCQFDFLFNDMIFADDLSSYRDVRGIEAHEKEWIFTDLDPKFEFGMKNTPIYYQFIFPVLFLLAAHLGITGKILRGKKEKYSVEITARGNGFAVLQIMTKELQQEHVRKKLLKKVETAAEATTFQYEIETSSMEKLQDMLQQTGQHETVVKYQLVSSRSGEAA